ncbi:MAG: bifunctional nuclease family protein, partial [Candidatus Omnitrophica bacterium]|nr:bifunctional nuclease family protein [Candidatus Omnitrophota bacterium]
TFYARIFIKKNDDNGIEIDARPSDSIALAVRAKVPIYVNEEVLKQAAAI